MGHAFSERNRGSDYRARQKEMEAQQIIVTPNSA